MHVGFLTLESPYDAGGGGGIAAYLRAMIPDLVQLGHRVTVFTHSRQREGEFSPCNGVRVLNLRLPNLHWYCSRLPLLGRLLSLPLRQLEWSRAFSAAVAELMARDPLDVLESLELGALFLARRPPAPLVIRLHGSDYVFRKYSGQTQTAGSRWSHRLERAVWQGARAITSPSCFQAREVTEEMHWPAERIEVIANPIAPEVLAEALANDQRQPADPIVLYTGRLAVVKGTAPLLGAIPLVQRQCPQAQFLLAGPWQMPDGPQKWGLERSSELGGQKVAWLGHVPWRKLMDCYRRAAVFVMPSYYETFGISCVEAMAFGLPVVATRAGGLPEVVEDGVTGLLAPPGDSAALADAVCRLLADADLRRRMGEAGRERVLSQFTAKRIVQETITVYERARS
jgi:glycogen(starch) synthase